MGNRVLADELVTDKIVVENDESNERHVRHSEAKLARFIENWISPAIVHRTRSNLGLENIKVGA